MAWVTIEIEYICPICSAVSIEPRRLLVRDVNKDVRKYLVLNDCYCIECNASHLSLPMEIARISVPEKDSFGASLF